MESDNSLTESEDDLTSCKPLSTLRVNSDPEDKTRSIESKSVWNDKSLSEAIPKGHYFDIFIKEFSKSDTRSEIYIGIIPSSKYPNLRSNGGYSWNGRSGELVAKKNAVNKNDSSTKTAFQEGDYIRVYFTKNGWIHFGFANKLNSIIHSVETNNEYPLFPCVEVKCATVIIATNDFRFELTEHELEEEVEIVVPIVPEPLPEPLPKSEIEEEKAEEETQIPETKQEEVATPLPPQTKTIKVMQKKKKKEKPIVRDIENMNESQMEIVFKRLPEDMLLPVDEEPNPYDQFVDKSLQNPAPKKYTISEVSFPPQKKKTSN